MRITFFGHRDFRWTEDIEKEVLDLLDSLIEGEAEFYLGEYGAFDNFAYACVKKYKEKRGNTRLIMVTPYFHASYQENKLKSIREKYDEIIYPPLENVPLKFSILFRNNWMVEQADVVIVYVNRDWGGAYTAYRYARRKKKRIINIAETAKNHKNIL